MTPAVPDLLGIDVELVQGLAAVPRVLSVCLRASGMGVVAVARVTEGRWVACAVLDRIGFGLAPGGELPVDTTLCGVVRDLRAPIVIEHASQEAAWCDHPTPRLYAYESHVSVPILLPDGEVWGTLVAIDPQPLPVRAPDTVATFTLFAELLGLQIDAERRLRASREVIEDLSEESTLRERFIAVLGHDLKNPLAAIDAGVRLLGREALTPGGSQLLGLMRGAVGRMSGLVDEVLDFARGRLGGGIPTARREVDLAPLIGQIVDEFRQIHPETPILAEIDLAGPVSCDGRRIGQMISNLVACAIEHGEAGEPVRVEARVGPERASSCPLDAPALVIAVANRSPAIPEAALADLFRPFSGGSRDGLGLSLFIAAEIAQAHGGRLDATMSDGETRLTFVMPLGREAEEAAA